MLIHWIWYATLPNVGLKKKIEILQHFSDPEEIFNREDFDGAEMITPELSQTLNNKDLSLAREVMKCCRETKVGILTMVDAGYPLRLKQISEPPLVLYYKGVLPDFEGQPVIGVVGTRKASAYGMNVARTISQELALCGGLVVSGGAGGIDTAALHGAGSTGSQTVAVLGCGVNVDYPKTNRELFAQIASNGCVMSEYLPDSKPKQWQFPQRNRIISGLSHGVLVVEAPTKSGAMITARDALRQGRDVFAVPENVHQASAGNNQLLEEFAKPAASGWEVLKAYAEKFPYAVARREVQKPNFSRQKAAETAIFSDAEKRIEKKDVDNPNANAYSDLEYKLTRQEEAALALLDLTPKSVDSVIAQMELPAVEALRILTDLSLRGLVVNHPGRMVSANYR